jgi:hypothetical protein
MYLQYDILHCATAASVKLCSCCYNHVEERTDFVMSNSKFLQKNVQECALAANNDEALYSSTEAFYFLLAGLKGLCHQIRITRKWYCFQGLGMDMRRLIFKNLSLQFLIGI